MAIEVMKRYENKYLLDSNTYLKLLNKISQLTKIDEYNRNSNFYTISNLYYDTEDNNLIRRSLSKPKYKEKLRLRAYGIPKKTDKVYLEIKKKYNGLVNKRRTQFALEEAYEFASTGSTSPKEYMNKQVLSELEYFIQLYKPLPKLYLAYDRRAYFGEDGLRITFDTNIRTRRYDLKLEAGDYGENLMDSDLWLMEVKAVGAIPLWLTSLLSEYRVYRNSFSKYGTEYQKFIAEERNDSQCLNQFLVPQTKSQPYRSKMLSLQWQ